MLENSEIQSLREQLNHRTIALDQTQERLAESRAALVEAQGLSHYEWASRLAEALADVRALAELAISLERNLPILQRDIGHYSIAIQALTVGCEEVLDRPSVKRVMEEQEETA